MKIIGYCVSGNKQYVAFASCKDIESIMYKLTDGFHDKVVTKRNLEKYEDYRWVYGEEIDLDKIVNRLRGTRPWHPLLKVLKEEVTT